MSANIPYYIFPFLKRKWDKITVSDIINISCNAFQIHPEVMKSDTRKTRMVLLRNMIANLLNNHKSLTDTQIGKLLNRDRTSVIHMRESHKLSMIGCEIYSHNYCGLVDLILHKREFEIKKKEQTRLIKLSRKGICDKVLRMNIDESFEITQPNYFKVVSAINHASKHWKQYKDLAIKTARIGNGKYKITRIK